MIEGFLGEAGVGVKNETKSFESSEEEFLSLDFEEADLVLLTSNNDGLLHPLSRNRVANQIIAGTVQDSVIADCATGRLNVGVRSQKFHVYLHTHCYLLIL